MYIDKFIVSIQDFYTKKIKRVKIDADTALYAHKKGLDYCNALTQDIYKITNAEKEVVYTLADGFTNE
jgi:hypothetical protein